MSGEMTNFLRGDMGFLPQPKKKRKKDRGNPIPRMTGIHKFNGQ